MDWMCGSDVWIGCMDWMYGCCIDRMYGSDVVWIGCMDRMYGSDVWSDVLCLDWLLTFLFNRI